MKYLKLIFHPTFLIISICYSFLSVPAMAQELQWKNVSTSFDLKTNAIQVFESTSSTLNDSAFKAYYVLINTNDPNL